MNYKRSSGIILHPTSLPGPDGIGDLGPEAYRWIQFLYDSGCELWQVLPLGPTGYGDSPYQCFSAFAGNPYLVSPALLFDAGLLTREDLSMRPAFSPASVDYGAVIQWKTKILDLAYAAFLKLRPAELTSEYDLFRQRNANWLRDFALFMAIKETQGGQSWDFWPEPLRKREPAALQQFKRDHIDRIDLHQFRQFLFFHQWKALRAYAAERGITVIGDIPIFVAYDSADAWANPELFFFDDTGEPTVVAGVPPDYFSPTGQLWGNPLYRWNRHKELNYAWWIERFQASLKLVDIIRLDHFRGFSGYWEVDYGRPTAEIGRWVKGPGEDFFKTIQAALGDLPIIAEDLGVITEDVVALRDQFGLPGMKILQFGFGSDPDDPFLPHNYVKNCVAYTGTHDNDTTRGWYENAPASEQDFCRRYFACPGTDIAWDMMRALWSSVAMMTLAPAQDLFTLGSSARMNYPGKPHGNWQWRLHQDYDSSGVQIRLHDLNFLFSRLRIEPGQEKKKSMHSL